MYKNYKCIVRSVSRTGGVSLYTACSSLGLDLLLVHFARLSTMCRVRFGLTGIYFDSLEPSRPREEFIHPLNASIPPVAQKKLEIAVPELVDRGNIRERAVIATDVPENTKDLSDSSWLSSRGEGRHLKTNCASKGRKRVHNSASSSSSLSSSSSSPSSYSSSSSPSWSSEPSLPLSDEDQAQKLANNKINVQALKPPFTSRTTPKHNKKACKRQISTPSEGLTKAPPPKRVRFAMDLQERIVPSDDLGGTSSSHSSDDSYTDPPSPTEPHDAFGGYYRPPGVSRCHGTYGQNTEWRMRTLSGTEGIMDDCDGFLDSDDGSGVDVQGVPVKGRPPRTVQATKADHRHHHHSPKSLGLSNHLTGVRDQSRNKNGGLKSNVNSGLHFDMSRASERPPMSSPQSGKHLRYPRLRSGRNVPEPIFVVRPGVLADSKEKRKPGDALRSSGCRGIPKKGYETPTSDPIRVKAPTRNRPHKYCHPAVTDDLKKDAEVDQDLGMLIRDV